MFHALCLTESSPSLMFLLSWPFHSQPLGRWWVEEGGGITNTCGFSFVCLIRFGHPYLMQIAPAWAYSQWFLLHWREPSFCQHLQYFLSKEKTAKLQRVCGGSKSMIWCGMILLSLLAKEGLEWSQKQHTEAPQLLLRLLSKNHRKGAQGLCISILVCQETHNSSHWLLQ